MEKFSVTFNNDDYSKLMEWATELTQQAGKMLGEDHSHDTLAAALTMLGESDGILTALNYILHKRNNNA